MLLVTAIFLFLAFLAIKFARVTHVALILLFFGTIVGGAVLLAAGLPAWTSNAH